MTKVRLTTNDGTTILEKQMIIIPLRQENVRFEVNGDIKLYWVEWVNHVLNEDKEFECIELTVTEDN